MHTRIILLFLLFGGLSAKGQTLESLLSAPVPTELTASADGKILAWVLNASGSRNIWIAEAPAFIARQRTEYQGDDGVEITGVTISADGHWLVYTRGNTNNLRGEPANPAMLTTPPERTIWVMDTRSGLQRSIGKGYYPKISPDGTRLAFLQQGKIWTASLSDSLSAPRVLVGIRGPLSQPRWSPNGEQLVFVANRGDHSFIGLHDISTGYTRYLETGIDQDQYPCWSADGSKIAFLRVPNIHNRTPFAPYRSANPWSIRIHDLKTGITREAWKADTGRGSVFVQDIPAADNLLWWSGPDQLVFPWEKDGWLHLYQFDLTTRDTRILTTGQGEVENVRVNEQTGEILYTANIGDIDRRHIWKTSAKNTTPFLLTPGDGIEWSPVPVNNGLAMLRSSATRPAWPALWRDGKIMELAAEAFPAAFPTSLVTPQAVQITATDGLKVPAQLFLPRNMKAGEKRPAVIFLHGGSRRQMLLGFHYSQYYANAYALNQYMASQGFVVLSLNYRSGIGYGLEFREALEYGATGASEVRDLLGAGKYLQQRADVDPKKIGLWGGSYGGYLTAHGLSQAGDVFACGVDIHGVHNWNDEMPTFAPWYRPADHPAFAKKAFESSPEFHVHKWKNPVLLIHGDDDRNVPFNETVRIAEILRRQGVEVEQLVVPDEVHGFLRHQSWLMVQKATAEYLLRRLK